MNPYTELLKASLEEIDQFSRSEDGYEWKQEWYNQLKALVTKAANESRQERAEELMDMISWSIVDSGPLGKGFAPSIDQAQEALIKVRKQRDINIHKKA